MQVSIPGICQQSGPQLELELDDLVAYYNRIMLDPDSPEGGHTIQAEEANRQMPCKWAAWQVVEGGAVLYHDASSNAVESWNNRMLLGRQNMQLAMLLPYVFDVALRNAKRAYLRAKRTYRRLNKELRVDERKLRMIGGYFLSRAEGVRGVFCVSRAKEGAMRKHWVDVQKKTCTCGWYQCLGYPCIHAEVLVQRGHLVYEDAIYAPLQHSVLHNCKEQYKLWNRVFVEAPIVPVEVDNQAFTLPAPKKRRRGRETKRRYRPYHEKLFK